MPTSETQEPISLHHGHCTISMERFLLPVSETLASNLALCPFARQDRKETEGRIRSTQVARSRSRIYGLGYDSLMGDARTMHRVAGQGQKQKQSVVVATSTSVLFDSQASSMAVWSEGRHVSIHVQDTVILIALDPALRSIHAYCRCIASVLLACNGHAPGLVSSRFKKSPSTPSSQ